MVKNLNELKVQLDLVNVIERHVSLKPRGARYTGLCPFHTEKTPSFTVTPALGIFKCFGCGKSGDVFAFEQAITGKGFLEAVESLAREFNLQLDKTALQAEDLQAYQQQERLYLTNASVLDFWLEQQPCPEQAAVTLSNRAIQPGTLQHFQLALAPEKDSLSEAGNSPYFDKDSLLELGLLKANEHGNTRDFFRKRIIFPIRTPHGKIAGFAGRRLSDKNERLPKYLNSPDSAIFKKGALLFGLFENSAEIRRSKDVLLVEGYFDVLTLWEHGFQHAAAVCGTALTPEQAKLLRKYAERVTLLFDGDSAGAEAMCKALPVLDKAGLFVRACPLPAGTDPDAYLREVGAEKFRQYLAEHTSDAIIWLAHYRSEQIGADGLAKQKLLDELKQFLNNTPFVAMKNQWAKTIAKLLGVRVKQLADQKQEVAAEMQAENPDESGVPDSQDNFQLRGYFESERCYFRKDGKRPPIKVSNFILHPLYQINTKQGAQRLFRLENEFGETHIARFSGNSLISVDAFQQVVEQCGNYVFHGRKVDLSVIKERVFAELPICQEIDRLGWQEQYGFWAWSNGIAKVRRFSRLMTTAWFNWTVFGFTCRHIPA